MGPTGKEGEGERQASCFQDSATEPCSTEENRGSAACTVGQGEGAGAKEGSLVFTQAWSGVVLWTFPGTRYENKAQSLTGQETWLDLPPFVFGRTPDRGNGKNLCRPHPDTWTKA
jgi:hypothetical protein